MTSSYDYLRPTSLAEAFELEASHGGARFIAGGTDLMVALKGASEYPPALISLVGVEELRGIEVGETTRLGGMTTISEILAHEELGAAFPVLAQAAAELGSVQIRNVATVGGNLCNASPCADMALPLMILEATVKLQGPGAGREIPLEELFSGPKENCLKSNEIVTEINIPKQGSGARATFMKKGRVKMDIAVASVATLIELDGPVCRVARVAAGSVAPVPLRLTEVEKLLEGVELDDDKIAEARALASKSVSPISDLRASDAYRRQLVGVYVERSINQLRG